MKKAGNVNTKLIRILQIGLHDKIGGIETFLMNYYKSIDRKKVQFDFISPHKKMAYEASFKNNGAIIYHIDSPKKNPIRYYCSIKNIIQKNNYRTVHVHMRSAANILPIIAAKRAGATCIIAHSHSTNTPRNPIKRILHFINRPFIKQADIHLACSKSSGAWMFKKTPYNVCHNAINLNSFKYDQNKRSSFREKYSIPNDAFVIGHIGRFSKEKNQKYIIDIFKDVLKSRPNTKLILAGDGKTQKKIKSYAKKININKNIIFTGLIEETASFYSAIDVFVLPSLYEGLPVCCIEAQASGVKCILSNKITSEVNIQNTITNISITKKSIPIWVKTIIETRRGDRDLPENTKQYKLYDIGSAHKELEHLYLKTHNQANTKRQNQSTPSLHHPLSIYTTKFIQWLNKYKLLPKLIPLICACSIAQDMLPTIPLIGKLLPLLNVTSLLIALFYVTCNIIQKKDKTILKYFILLCGLALIVYLTSRETTAIKIALLTFTFYYFGFINGLKIDFTIRLIYIITVVGLSSFGITNSFDYTRLDGSIRQSFGFIHPNTFGMCTVILLLEIMILTYRASNWKKYLTIILSIILASINFFLSNSRSSTIIIILSTIVYAIPPRELQKHFSKRKNNILTHAFLIAAITSFVLAIAFTFNIPGINKINALLSERPHYSSVYLKFFPITLFGNNVAYRFWGMSLDNMYIYTLLHFGIAQFIVYCILSTRSFKELKKHNHFFLISIITITLLYGIVEHTILRPGTNYFILAFSYALHSTKRQLATPDKVKTRKPKKVSIIIPTYNNADTLSRCIESILNQTYVNFEIIIINDGSTDITERILENFTKNPKIKSYYQQNSGPSSARNYGIRKATGDYICFIDADDTIAPTYLSNLLSLCENNDADMAVCNINYIYDNKIIQHLKPQERITKTPDELLLAIATDIQGYLPNKLYRTSTLSGIYFDESVQYCEDLLFNVTIAQRIKKAVITSESLYNYYQNKNSITKKKYCHSNTTILLAYRKILSTLQEKNPSTTQIYYKQMLITVLEQQYLCKKANLQNLDITTQFQDIIIHIKNLIDKNLTTLDRFEIFLYEHFTGMIINLRNILYNI